MSVVLGSVAVLLTLSSFASALCPRKYQPASPDKCFKPFVSHWDIRNYCGAQWTCEKYNGRLVEGPEWLRILANPSSAPWTVSGLNSTWIGLTDLLEERGTDKDGWQWTSGGRAVASDIPWIAGEPNDTKHDCAVFFKGEGMKDVPCDAKGGMRSKFICEPVVLPKRPTQFVSASLAPVTPKGFAKGECRRFMTIERFDCFAECFHFGAKCKAIYFNAEKKSCLILKYNDASLNVDSKWWKKFKVIQ